MKKTINTEYALGQVVKHKYLDFRGVIYDVDPEFNNTEEWYQSIPVSYTHLTLPTNREV